MHVLNDWPDDERSSQQQQEMERDRRQQEEEIEEAWANVEHDISYAKHAMWSTEDDIKLLKRALGIK